LGDLEVTFNQGTEHRKGRNFPALPRGRGEKTGDETGGRKKGRQKALRMQAQADQAERE
jgi:hypothetical protein